MKLIIRTSVICLLMTIGTSQLYSCVCNFFLPDSIKSELHDKSTTFLTGRVLNIRTVRENIFSRLKIQKVKIEIIENFNGAWKKENITIATYKQAGMCGYRFEKGKKYLIALRKDEHHRLYFTNIFLPNQKLKNAKENIKTLRKLYPK